MTDVVLKFPVKNDAEARLFGDFLSRFIETSAPDAELWAANSDAPYVILRSDPQPDVEMKVLIFQERSLAQAFSTGWAAACGASAEAV